MQFFVKQGLRRKRGHLPVALATLTACALFGAYSVSGANAAEGDGASAAEGGGTNAEAASASMTLGEPVDGVARVAGEGFTASSEVLIYVTTTAGAKDAELTADENGEVSANVRLPADYAGPVDVVLLSDDKVVNKLLFDASGKFERDEKGGRVVGLNLDDSPSSDLASNYEEFDTVTNELEELGNKVEEVDPASVPPFLAELANDQADLLMSRAQAELEVLEVGNNPVNGKTKGDLIASQNQLYEDLIDESNDLLARAKANVPANVTV